MFDIGFQELLLIMVLALLVFGPSKLPELGKMIGRAMREFRRATDEFRSTVETNLNINAVDESPTIAPAVTPGGVDGVVSAASPTGVGAPGAEPETAAEGSETAGPSEGSVGEAAPTGAPYCAQRGSRLLHRRDCAWVARIPVALRVQFETVAAGRAEGHVKCPVCEPWEEPSFAV
jgi:sec-independent protein translocase protein TatB